MGTADELSFKVAQAKRWKESVLNELELVDGVLDSVAIEVQTTPSEDDTIMKGLKAGGDALQNSYKKLGNNFKTTVNGLDEIIETWQTMISNLLQGLQETVKKIGLDS